MGPRAGLGGATSSPAPQDMAATRRFSRRIVSQSLCRSSMSISLLKNTNHQYLKHKTTLRPANTHYSTSLMFLKLGRLCGSYDQHCDISEYSRGGQFGGNGSRSPFSSFPITSQFLIPWNGFTPSIRISQVQTPKKSTIRILTR